MAGEEKFPIVVEIKPDTAPGERAVGQSLDRMEKDAKDASKQMSAAISGFARDVGGAVRDAMMEVEKLRASEERAAAAARQAAEEEREWAAAISKAKDAIAEQDKAMTRALDGASAGVRKLKDDSTDTLTGMIKGWKDVTRTIGDVGHAINAVKAGIDLATKAWELSKVAASAAAEVWRAAANSGPSAYVGGASRQQIRLAEAQRGLVAGGLGAHWGGATIDAMPREIQAAIRNVALDNAAFEKVVTDYVRARNKVLDEINRKFQEDQARLASHRDDASIEARAAEARAAEAKARADAARAARGTGRLSVDDPDRFSLVTDGVQLAQAALDKLTESYYDAAGAAEEFFDAADGGSGHLAESAVGRIGVGGVGFRAIEKAKKNAIDFADALQGPVGNAVDGLIDGLVRWDMAWKDWGRSALAEIAKVMIRLLALQAIQGAFGAGGGGGLGGFLWGLFGGPSGGGSSARMAPGDTFGGAGGSTSGAVWRAPVMPSQAPGGGGSSPVINVKVVNVGDMRAAALEALASGDGERVVVNHYARNSGKLAAR